MPPGRKGARNKKSREASVVPQSPPAPPPPPSPPQHSKPLSMPAPAARLSRTTRTSSKDIQPRGHLPARQAEEQKQRGVTPQRPVEPIPVDVLDVAERVEDVESEESEEDEGGVELIDETEWDSFNTRSMSASTSGTQLEADALDPTLAIEAIPALHRKSQDILEFLLASKPAQLLKKVRQPGSSAGKRLEMTTRDFSVTKDLFAASTEFIKVNVVNQLLDTDIFAPLICKANFAALALGLVRTIGLSNEAVQYLMGLENYFPGAFFPSPGDWEEGVRAQVNRLMLEIRTQLFIAAVYYEQAMPFDELLRQIFLEQEPDLESNEDDELHEAWAMGCKPKGWDLLTKEERRNCKSRINRIRSAYIVVDGGDDRLEPLDTEYLVQHWPWDKFVEDMMKFIAQRTAAINADSNFADLLDTAEQARKRGLESQEEDEDGLDNESISVVADTDAANDSNWLTDQSRTLVDAEVMGEGQAEGSANNRRRPSGDRLSSSAQLKFLKRQKMLLEAPNSPPAIKKASSQKPKIITSKAGMKALKSLAQSSANEAVAPAAPSARPPPPPPPPPAATQGKAGSRARATTNLPISVEQTNASAVNEPPNFDAGIDDIPIPAGTADQVALFKKLNAKRDKENRGAPPPKRSIYERQADAQKLSFNEDEELKETQSGDERAKARGQRGSKRSRDEVEDQAEEDPYAHDDRPEDPLRKKRSRVNPPAAPAARKKPPTDPRPAVVPLAQVARPERRRQLPAEFAPPPVRQQPVQGNELVPHRSRQTTPEAASRAVRRQRSGSALAPVPSRNLARRRSHDDLPQEIHGELTGERIRYLAASNRQRAIAKRPQVRQAWSQDEEDKLVEMVGLLGCRWAMIEHAASDVFAARGQVALKDKARNMKFSLLKSRLPLPPNFEHVTMGRRLLQELEQMGIDPNPPRAIQEAEYESTDSESEEEHRVIDRQHLARIREGREEA